MGTKTTPRALCEYYRGACTHAGQWRCLCGHHTDLLALMSSEERHDVWAEIDGMADAENAILRVAARLATLLLTEQRRRQAIMQAFTCLLTRSERRADWREDEIERLQKGLARLLDLLPAPVEPHGEENDHDCGEDTCVCPDAD